MDPQVAEIGRWLDVVGPSAHEREVRSHAEDLVAEAPASRLVLALQPAGDDSAPIAPRLSGWCRVVEGMLGEEIAEHGEVVRLPGPHVALDPGRDSRFVHQGLRSGWQLSPDELVRRVSRCTRV